MDIGGHPALGRSIERLQRCTTLDGIVVATTTHARDDVVVTLAASYGVQTFRGPEQDVLARYVGAAEQAGADIVARITADCPLIDPSVVDRAVHALRSSRYDFASNAITRSYPVGLDVEVMWTDVLARVDRMATTPQAREHVCWYLYRERPDLFAIREVRDDEDNSDLCWTLDTMEDLEHIRSIYDDVDYRTLIQRERAL